MEDWIVCPECKLSYPYDAARKNAACPECAHGSEKIVDRIRRALECLTP